jgi:hypothetical protein
MHKRCVVFHKLNKLLLCKYSLLKDLVIIQITKSGLNYLNCANILIRINKDLSYFKIESVKNWISSKVYDLEEIWQMSLTNNNAKQFKLLKSLH